MANAKKAKMEGSKKNKRSEDPIKKVLRVNNRAYKFSCAMNEMLLKVLERYELDKPILMADKLDIIWDKSKGISKGRGSKAPDLVE